MTTSRLQHLVLAALVAAFCGAQAAPAGAGPGNTPVGGTVTLTGTDGRDEVFVSVEGGELLITPAVGFTSTQGACTADVDPLTGRPVQYRCINGGEGGSIRVNLLVINLLGGNDSLTVSVDHLDAVTASGGAGNDELVVAGPNRKLLGGDGDDVLVAIGGGLDPVLYDGGPGRDLVDFGSGGFSGAVVGATASLATGLATFRIPNAVVPTARTDTLTGIERLSGTGLGDILTGASGADELLGQAGPDVIKGGDGNDNIGGGPGNDELTVGKGVDTVDGGTGIDTFVGGDGGDTFNTRDGFLESVGCVSKDVLVADLVDKLLSPEKCLSVSIAAAKHRHDTRLSRRSLRIGGDDALRVRVSCPRAKTERCAGRLRARLGGRRGPVLDGARYRLRRGRAITLVLELTAGEARRTRGATVTLQADEVDSDGRERRVLQRVHVR